MVLLTCDNLTKAFSQKKLLDSTGFSIESGDKIGIVGVNGTGKTTLLKIVAGGETADKGTIIKANGLKIGFLMQEPVFGSEETILQYVSASATKNHGENREYLCKTILTKLELYNFDEKISNLSGGQKKRVALAGALVCDVDLLILDEPTNHIDSNMVTWLEGYLASYKGAVLMVTHDRYFLDRVTNRILELSKGKIYSYNCNYTKFLQMKAQREEMEIASERKRQSLIRREVEWILQGPCARGTKSQYRIERLEKLKAENVDLSKSSVEMSSISTRLGKKVIELANVSKGFGDKKLIDNFSYNILRDDRIGIIGRNGVGKSTLLKLIMGIIPPDSGEISVGETVNIGYFSQECEQMNPDIRPIDYIKEISNAIETVDGVLTASQLLEKFLFTDDLQYTTISRLSGGEKRRLYLLKILTQSPNVLILDEPTNDLDIETLTILEDYLSGFKGAVIMVSHDRYFLDKTAGKIFSFEDGEIKIYMGGYTDWLIRFEDEREKPSKQEKPKQEYVKSPNKKLKFTFKEEREFNTIDQDIADIEQEISLIDEKISLSASDFQLLQELMAQKEQMENTLSLKMERWVYLNDLNDRINGEI